MDNLGPRFACKIEVHRQMIYIGIALPLYGAEGIEVGQ